MVEAKELAGCQQPHGANSVLVVRIGIRHFWWFALALDTLYALGLVAIEQELLTRVDRDA